MARVSTRGKCELCGGWYQKSGMGRHLRNCLVKTALPKQTGRRHVRSIHIVIEDDYRPEYWMHVAVPASARLYQLDQYLRDVWLECCGHLSLFDIGKTFYCGDYVDLDPFGLRELLGESNPDQTMDVAVGRVAPPGVRFRYEYDFGTTSLLNLRSAAEISGPAREINLLARNEAPTMDCTICGSQATWVGPSDDDWMAMTGGLCDSCAPTSEFRLPIFNSPRSGVCGYDGPLTQIVDDDDKLPERR